jgi:Rv2525c-like, glycoside hydrolase-like domain
MRRIGSLTAACAAAGVLLATLPGAALAAPPPGHNAAVRVLSYRGYQVRVPASWPVYRLAADPSRCVLFNRHAVYLGRPGASQHCPVRAFGRTEALLIQPLGPDGSLPPGTSVQRAAAATAPPGAMAAARAGSHAVQLALPAAGVQVTASFGHAPGLISHILAGARLVRGGSAGQAAASHAPQAPPAHPGPPGTATSSGGQASGRRAAAATVQLSGEKGHGLGFDACTAPSVATMTAWLNSPYRVAGTYLGGDNWACAYGNFTTSWVSQVAAEGWRFVPIWVGPQAPCSTIPGAVLIDPSQAAAEGEAQAASAVSTAASFGYGTGTPVYFDMEGYNTSVSGCSQAVLNFLQGWTQGLHAAGYTSGVYSSAASGIADLASQYGQSGYTAPDDIWIADWTGDPVLSDPYVPSGDWSMHQRLHQYYGGHNETWGGATVNVDDDVADGAVAGLKSAPSPSPARVLGHPDAVAVPPGGHATANLVFSRTGSGSSTVQWQVQAPSGLTVTPAQGSVSVTAGTPVTVKITVAAAASAVAGRYDLPVTSTSGTASLAETFLLASVAPSGGALPTAHPVVLYAADTASMNTAVAIAGRLALPPADVTGTFSTAWTDLTGGKDLLLAVGQAALNGLFTNPCGWSNPAGEGAGHTPFAYLGEPLRTPPGANYFENSAGSNSALTSEVTQGLTHYALAGSLPNEGVKPAGPAAPTSACLGSPTVPVP